MKYSFGDKMKDLRKKSDLTQEQCAEYLGVTFQAVSKWENNLGYPDICLLASIANLYRVTTDELLGVDNSKINEKINAYLLGCRELQHEWKLTEAVDLARKGCQEFPGNLELMDNLSFWLHQAYGVMSKDNLVEAIQIAEKILERATISALRNRAIVRLCYCYDALGKKNRALEYANQLPTHPQTRTYIIGRLGLLQGIDQVQFSKDCIQSYYRALREVIIQYVDTKNVNRENKKTPQERVKMIEGLLQIQRIVYGDEMCDQHFEAYEFNVMIASLYLLIDDKSKAIESLEEAYNHAIEYMNYSDSDKYQSVYLAGQNSLPHHHYSRSTLDDLLDNFASNSIFNSLRQDQRFVAIIEKAKNYQRN